MCIYNIYIYIYIRIDLALDFQAIIQKKTGRQKHRLGLQLGLQLPILLRNLDPRHCQAKTCLLHWLSRSHWMLLTSPQNL